MAEEKNDQVNEDAAPYGAGRRLSDFFPGVHVSSMEEQSELNRKYSASLSPVERMAYMHQLILIAYAEELQKPVEELWDKKIYLDEITW